MHFFTHSKYDANGDLFLDKDEFARLVGGMRVTVEQSSTPGGGLQQMMNEVRPRWRFVLCWRRRLGD